MKTMKNWRNIFVICTAMLSLTSCGSDDDDKFDASIILFSLLCHFLSRQEEQHFVHGPLLMLKRCKVTTFSLMKCNRLA